MEYYFQDQLRWSYGFENPNKAAALIASLLPLVWLLAVMPWRFKRPALKWAGMLAGGVILCAGWWLLFKTYSRGGIVAAAVAFAYIGFRKWDAVWKVRFLVLACAAVIVGLFVSTNAAERSVGWIGNHEGSVENRFILWKGGLEMLAANPQGVGSGRSGELYMQWYEPLELTARYRTMVNSYLTFAVERGLWCFGAACMVALVVWKAGGSGRMEGLGRDVATGLRGALLACGVAGLFSTTMEDARLWIVPALCVAGMGALAFMGRGETGWKTLFIQSTILSAVMCGMIFATGFALERGEPLRIRLGDKGNKLVTIEPAQKNAGDGPRVRVIVDEEVMGADYGKLLRRLALATGLRVALSDSTDAAGGGETILVAGQGVGLLQNAKDENLVLLSPARIGDEEAVHVLRSAKSVKLLVSSFDEDGRVAFWNDAAHAAGDHARIQTVSLDGVGTKVEWAWEAVIGQFNNDPR